MPTKRSTPSVRMPRVVLILSSYSRRVAAERTARFLVRDRLAACATAQPGGRTFYRWKGRDVAGATTLLWAKTTAAAARRAVRAIRESHPDEVPEILVLPVAACEPRYLAWVAGEVGRRR